MTVTQGLSLTAQHKALLRAVAAKGGENLIPLRDGRKPWRLERGGPGWKELTFEALAEAGYLRVEWGFSMTVRISMTEAGYAAIANVPSAGQQPTIPKLQPPQMRALRLMAAIGTEVHSADNGAPRKSTLEVLARFGYVELTYIGDLWRARVTQAGRDKVSPPPIEPGISLAMFVLTSPDGWASNAENGAEALGQLAAQMDWYAPILAHQGLGYVADRVRAAAQRLRGMDPDHVNWPVCARFETRSGTFVDFIAARCRSRQGES